ncbi:MAG TPA: hypothetical protein VL096_10680 [Pirellulaceae bacterium]|nr:hypothetical protein [Pirellulaceae bacterium]
MITLPFLPPTILAATSFGATLLAIVLWGGLAGLTIALLVLMRTRFGQARPLSKCIALSLYAHVLLMTYAYGTKLVIPAPPGGGDAEDVVQLQLLAGEDAYSQASDPTQLDDALSPAPWDQLPVETPPESSLAAPARQDTQVRDDAAPPLLEESRPPELESTADTSTKSETPPRPDVPVPDVPQRAKPAEISATPADVPEVQRREIVDSIQPAAASPARLKTSDAIAGAEQPPEELLGDPAERVQQLTELMTTSNIADALAASSDLLKASRPEATSLANATAVAAASSASLVWINRELTARVPRRLADGEPVPELYRMRVAADRHRIARRLGATKESDKAVDAAIRWLSLNQADDGHWSAKQFGAGEERKVLGQDRQGAGADADTGISGLALLSLLGAGHTHLEGPYRETVQRGLEYLVRQQKEDGSLAGDAKLYAMMYCHGMASLALGEAYGMTGDHRLKPYVEKAGAFSIRAQHGTTGGWRYLPGDPGDMSQFGWQVMALKSAEMAGVAVPEKTHHGMLRFLHNNTSGRHHGLASYRAGERPSRTMTAEAFACRVLLNLECSGELSDEAIAFVLEDLPKDGKPDFYYWYYGSLAMFQVQDERWKTWNEALQQQLVKRQLGDGDMAGSYDTEEVWSGYGGRVYTTAMAALCLEVYYRYLPIYGHSE